MLIEIERKIEVNRWIINSRWFYVSGILLIGFATKAFSKTNINFSFISMISLFLLVFAINLFFYLFIRRAEVLRSRRDLNVLGFLQITVELLILTLVMHNAGGIDSISFVYYFLPIFSAALLFGFTGAVTTAVLAGFLVNGLVILEFYDLIPHVNRYGIITLEYQSLDISLTKTVTISFFYIITGVFSGISSRLLTKREALLKQETMKLLKESEYRKNEWSQLDKTTKLLVKRDNELSRINNELDEKIRELKKSEIAMLKAFTDLKNERKRVEIERNKTAAIISNFIDPIIVIDADKEINFLNPTAKQVFGFSETDLGKEVSSAKNYSMKNFKKIINVDFKVKTGEEIKSHDPNEEEVIIDSGGQELTYKVITAQVIDNEKKDWGVMKIFYNLTREKMIDKLKSEFISIAAHQLRTPLSAIKWVIKMILDGDVGKLTEEQYRFLLKGYQSNERIIELVNDMLNVSRIEEGRFGYTFEKHDLAEIILSQADNLEGLMKKKQIKFSFNKPKKSREAYLDKQRMELVIQNLLENAVKYTPEFGKIEARMETGSSFLKVWVKDNGVGIPAKDQSKLFSKFYRAENVVRMQTEGSGLGLFIVKNIIKSHGGEITFSSVEGKGTEFVFTLPLKMDKQIIN